MKIKLRFSFHYVAYTSLFLLVVFSVISVVTATTPNPGHPWSELGDGVFTIANTQTVNRTYTFPDANATVLTTNAYVTVAQGGTGVGTLTGIVKGNGTGAFSAVVSGTDIKTINSTSLLGSGDISITGMTWPSGGAGIPNYSGSSSWGTSYTTTGSGTVLALATTPTFTTNITAPLILGGTSTTQDLTFQTTSGTGTTGADMHFLVGSAGGTEAMTILNDGKVGIGNTNPGQKLEVNGGIYSHTTSNQALLMASGDAGTYPGIYLRLNDDSVSRVGMELDGSDNGVIFLGSGSSDPDVGLSRGGVGKLYVGNALAGNYSGTLIVGNIGVGVSSPSARLMLPAGSATANTAPLKFTAGTNLTTAEAGAVEWNGTNLFITQTSGPTRKTIAYTSDITAQVYPSAGIANSTGSAWGTSYTTTGSGTVLALATTPVFVTPTLGVATATSINNLPLSQDNTDFNIKIGQDAGLNVVTGAQYNTFLGYEAGKSAVSGTNRSSNDYNTAIGYQSLYSNISGNDNVSVGEKSLYTNTTGYFNTAIGGFSLYSNTEGEENTALGYSSLYSNTTGYDNVANGFMSLYANTTGNYNIASGSYSMRNNITGSINLASGFEALYANISGSHNIANGFDTLFFNETGNNNTALGDYALFNSGKKLTAGAFITGISYTIKTTGTTDFTLIGSADSNPGTVFIATGPGTGTGTASSNTNNNTALGYQSGRYISSGSVANNSSYNSLYLGYDTRASADGNNNETVIGYGTIGNGSNTTTIGNTSTLRTYLTGLNLKAGTATAGTAPLKFTSGTVLGTTEAGAVEYDGTHLYFTATNGGSRYQLDQQSGGADALGSYIVQTATNAPANAQVLAVLGTGILKNTTATGILSIAIASDFPTLNQNTTGSAATLTTAHSIYGNSFNGSADLAQIIVSTYGGTGNGFTKFTGPTTTERTFTLPDASATLLYQGGALGTPASGVATNLTGTASGLTAGNVTNATFTTAFTVNTGTVTLVGNTANTSVLTLGSGASSISGTNTGDNAVNSLYSGLVTMTYPSTGIPNSTGSAWGTSYTTSGSGTVLALATTPTFTTNITAPLILGGTSTTQDLTFQTTSGVGATGADMHFLVGNNGATEAMTILNNGKVLIGATSESTSSSKLYVTGTTAVNGSTAGVIGILGGYTFNPTAGGVQVGNRFVVTNSPTTTANTAVGEIVRMVDNTTLSNLIRGLDITSNAGSNTAGTNTGLRASGATFGVQGITNALAGGEVAPAALYGENTGTTQGDILRLYSNTVTSAPSFATFYHNSTTFTGTGLLMDFATGSGTFSGNFIDFQKNNVSLFKVTNAGILSMGLPANTSTATSALCSTVANSTSPTAGTAYEIRDCSNTPVADYAEMYPVEEGVEYGDIVSTGEDIVNTYDVGPDGAIDWNKLKGSVSRLVKSDEPYQENVIGIVSNNYSDFSSVGYNIKKEDNPMPVALSGRVPVKISPNSSPIKVGDYLTTSLDKGMATRALKAGFVIGKALESWNIEEGENTIMVFVEQGYYSRGDINNFVGQITFDGLTFFAGDVEFRENVIFDDTVEFILPPLFNSDTAGFAVIKTGSKKVNIVFDTPYIATPVVNTTITFEKGDTSFDTDSFFSNDMKYIVIDKDKNGFTIAIDKTFEQDIRFSWIALSVKDPKIFESVIEGLVIEQEIPISPSPTLSTQLADITPATESTSESQVTSDEYKEKDTSLLNTIINSDIVQSIIKSNGESPVEETPTETVAPVIEETITTKVIEQEVESVVESTSEPTI